MQASAHAEPQPPARQIMQPGCAQHHDDARSAGWMAWEFPTGCQFSLHLEELARVQMRCAHSGHLRKMYNRLTVRALPHQDSAART